MIRDVQVETEQRKQRAEKTFGLTPGQAEDQTKLEGEANSAAGVTLLPSATAVFARLPSVERVRRKPYGKASAVDEAGMCQRV